MRNIVVENCKNMSISSYLLYKFPNLQKNMLYKALRNKDIKINDKRISKDVVITNGDTLVIYIDDVYLFGLPKKIDYIYKDSNILVAFKPQGLLSNNEDTSTLLLEPTFEEIVKKEYSTATICHRLDRNTSGLVIFALNKSAYDEVIKGFSNGYIHKKYIAYVDNCNFEKKCDSINMYLKKDASDAFVKIYEKKVSGAFQIITNYSVKYIDKKRNYAILEVEIPTGKTHQIRAQLAYINHPVIGDSKYGKNDVNRKFRVKRQLLFAYNYSFCFKDTSFLSYLNNTKITLPKDYYENKLGE